MVGTSATAGNNERAKTIVIVEDDADLLRVLIYYFRGNGYRTRGFTSADLLLQELNWSSQIDCIVTDVRLPGIDGISLLAELRACHCEIPVVVITGHGDIAMAVQAMKMGAADFVEKPMTPEHLEASVFNAIQRKKTASDRSAELAIAQSKLSKLTLRQSQVLDLIARGLTSKEIAAELQMSYRTVEGHRTSIMDRLEVNSLADLLRIRLLSEFRSG
jgi:FixJ family two-component response regulator